MKHEDFKKQLLKNPGFAKSYKLNKNRLAFKIATMLISARKFMGMTQEELAKNLKTRQSSVARMESGSTLPSLSFLKRVADVYDTDLIPPTFGFMQKVKNQFIEINTQINDMGWISDEGEPILLPIHPTAKNTAHVTR